MHILQNYSAEMTLHISLSSGQFFRVSIFWRMPKSVCITLGLVSNPLMHRQQYVLVMCIGELCKNE